MAQTVCEFTGIGVAIGVSMHAQPWPTPQSLQVFDESTSTGVPNFLAMMNTAAVLQAAAARAVSR